MFWLLAELARAAISYLVTIALSRRWNGQSRAHWLQTVCRRLLRVFHVELDTHGDPPATGLLVANHISYLDILVIGAL